MNRCRWYLAITVSLGFLLVGHAEDVTAQTAPLPSVEASQTKTTPPALDKSEETPPRPDSPGPTATNRVLVVLPERVDMQWHWFVYSDEVQHVVQSAVEKALIDKGVDVVDVTSCDAFDDDGRILDLLLQEKVLPKAAKAGANYLILGRAMATTDSQSQAYGVTVVRASAAINARLVRVSDGRVLAAEEAAAQAGGQTQLTACRSALQEAGKKLARQLAATVTKTLAGDAPSEP